MKQAAVVFSMLASSIAAPPVLAQSSTSVAPTIAEAVAELRDRSGKPIGKVTLVQRVSGVVLRGELEGAESGWRAIHVHEVGRCEGEFESAGGHFNPGDAMHGLDAGGPHAGDLPNFWVHDDGSARFEMVTNRFALTGIPRVASAAAGSSGDAAAGASPVPTLFDDDGAAIIVHARPDDHVSEPSGAAGDRLACGEIVRR